MSVSPAGQERSYRFPMSRRRRSWTNSTFPRETVFVFRDRHGRPTKKERRELDGLRWTNSITRSRHPAKAATCRAASAAAQDGTAAGHSANRPRPPRSHAAFVAHTSAISRERCTEAADSL